MISESELYREDTHTHTHTHTHTGMHTHGHFPDYVNERNWEIMSTYRSYILDSKFHFPLKILETAWRNGYFHGQDRKSTR